MVSRDTPFEVHRFVIQESLNLGIRNNEQHDDVSWALWEVPPPEPVAPSRVDKILPVAQAPHTSPFAFELCFDPRQHPLREVLPDCLRLFTSHGVPSAMNQLLAMTLTEATTNALDHGLLHLDSALKQEGFEAYDAVRKERLAAHEAGTLTLRFRLYREDQGAVCSLGIEVEDSGPGFDWRAWEQAGAADAHQASGRGLMIIRSVASEMSFNECGNCLRYSLSCG